MRKIISEDGIVLGNVFDKYQTKNPIYRYLTDRFLHYLVAAIMKDHPRSIIEVGCGEGHLSAHIRSVFGDSITIDACDFSNTIIRTAKELYGDAGINFFVGDIYALKPDRAYDLVICSEVLEHLREPHRALAALSRLSGRTFVFSVPDEPLWSILNLARLKYITDFGNTPGHLQHWSKRGFCRILEKEFEVVTAKKVAPWIIAVARKKVL
jgi:ubiquinone/menaquinone biosynthesis C-methylase UbiE